MARRTSRRASATKARQEALPQSALIPNAEHPDYVAGSVGETIAGAGARAEAPSPAEPAPAPMAGPQGGPMPAGMPGLNMVSFCAPLSGRYRIVPPAQPVPAAPSANETTIIVRVDVDRFFPQQRISIEASRQFPLLRAHAIAEVTSDECLGFNRRRVRATITFRDGFDGLIPGEEITFDAFRGNGLNYGRFSLTLSGGGTAAITHDMAFESEFFDPVEFEIDQVDNAGPIHTAYDTASHPNRPASLPAETLSLASIYQRAGFDVSLSPNTTIIPTADAGANGTWSDSEMHDAMVSFWSRFADRPQWALWVLYAARHDQGNSLGGIMFDDIGPNHRQGTAIFTKTFITEVPDGDLNPDAWRARMQFWTAVHEMGHAFNLAHAWQKALGTAQGASGDPWTPLANAPESRSFMNYPFRVNGGESTFFSDFAFRFDDEELTFMRHAPRRFVQMGNSNWFENHAFEAPQPSPRSRWTLKIRPNREENAYSFLEPVSLELKLTNNGPGPATLDPDMLREGHHVSILVQREGGPTRRWQPMATRCHELHSAALKAGDSIYGAHLVSASTAGWLIDEPGFYNLQAAVDTGSGMAVSNVLRLFVSPPAGVDEARIAPDYFTEDVGRALTFGGSPSLDKAMDVLQTVADKMPQNPAATHAAVAVSTPKMRDFKQLDARAGRDGLAIRCARADIDTAAKCMNEALIDKPDQAAETMGHIDYFNALDELADRLAKAGDDKGAKKVLQSSVGTMKKRKVLDRVVKATERKLARLK